MRRSHDRLNEAVAAYAPVAQEGRDRLFAIAERTAPYELNLDEGALVLDGHRFAAALLGSLSRASYTWLWAWANPAIGPDHPTSAASLRLRDEIGPVRGWWELEDDAFPLEGVIDAGYGPGASVASVAATTIGAGAYFGVDYGDGIAYLAITDPAVRRTPPSALTLPHRLRTAAAVPGHARAQALTYAREHGISADDHGRSVVLPLADGVVVLEIGADGSLGEIHAATEHSH